MRHQKHRYRLGRTGSHRKAVLMNLATSLIEKERIISTKARVKALRPFLEPLVTRAKSDSVANRRLVASVIGDKEAVKKLFDDLALRFKDRPGGYTRIISLGRRTGDAADMAVIEFVGEESSN